MFPTLHWSSLVHFLRTDRRSGQIWGNNLQEGKGKEPLMGTTQSTASRRSRVAFDCIFLNYSFLILLLFKWGNIASQLQCENKVSKDNLNQTKNRNLDMRSICLLRGNVHSKYFKVAKNRSKKSCVVAWELLDPCSVRTPSLTDLPDRRSAVQILKGL